MSQAVNVRAAAAWRAMVDRAAFLAASDPSQPVSYTHLDVYKRQAQDLADFVEGEAFVVVQRHDDLLAIWERCNRIGKDVAGLLTLE